MIKGILLDVDGTLVLSNDAHAESWVRAFQKFGYNADLEQVRRLIGMGGDKLVPEIQAELSKDEGVGKKINDYRTELFEREYVGKLKPTPGTREFVQFLLDNEYKVMVASSASGEELENLLKAAQVNDLLNQATTSDDAEGSKPDPDIVHAALEKLGIQAHEVIMIGDTPYDIQAASRAGVGVIAFRSGGWSDADLVGSLAVYDNPADLLRQFKQSPVFS